MKSRFKTMSREENEFHRRLMGYIRYMVSENQLSYRDMRATGINSGTMSQISHGDPGPIPSIVSVRRFAEYFGQSLQEFISNAEQFSP